MIRKPRTTELNVDFLVRMTTLKNIHKFYYEITTVRTYKLFSTGCCCSLETLVRSHLFSPDLH